MMDSTSMMGNSSMMGMCLLMFIGFIFIIGLIGVTTFLVIRLLMRNNKVMDNPLMLLKERFVKGEISEEEYEQKKKTLNKK
ncbi:SHOCT domain-containing protein [Metabacillus idriensis]|uniref:SHOCT domain-containing protein n=1 Tax=Metabacillus idriensis TaxID=324768 RepID=UPI000916E18A|nr:SHOCT domain-containing protein [Metabacillus idriensis]MCM3597950.1 SHOCT domain-containing protein [Metabacillus idriensis]OHR73623.1 hypothetical protein HMPREF3291_18700 [Bacillus sp. HMSC76G11]